VDVLGPIRTWRGDAEIRLGPTRQRALFAVLALHHGRTATREQLIRAVWGDEPPTTAEGSVHTYVSGLRRALEPNRSSRAASTVLLSEDAGYRLALDDDGLDAVVFETLAARAADAVARGDARDAVDLADQALALWRGEPLTGLPGPFLAAQRDRLVAARLDLLETRAAAALLAGRHADLVAELTALVGENPLHEGLRGLLMIALYRCGRQAEALGQFRLARLTLAEELGAKPGARLAEIHQQVLVNDPALAAPAPEPGAGAGARRTRRAARPRQRAIQFVGRNQELDELSAAVAALAEGKGQAVWLEGEPGIGKSELLTAGLAGLDDADVEVCWGAGDELAQRFTLRVIRECLAVAPESADPRRARLAELMLRSSARDEVLGRATTAVSLVDEVVALVRQLCQDRPLALVVDDVQWVDEASMLAWSRLARATDQLPLLVIGACRPLPRSGQLQSMRETAARRGGIMLGLDRLPDPAVGELLHAIVRAIPGPGLRRLAERAAGNPLYLQELVDALVREETVEITADGTADVASSADVTAPTSLASALARRLGFLSQATVDVLRRAALFGTEFRLDELAAVLVRPASELIGAVGESTTARVLTADGDRLAFRHPLIRQALYEGMGHAVRAALHRQAAERLDRAGASMDIVAAQLAAAPDTVDGWTIGWVAEHGEHLAGQAPGVGLELLQRVVTASDPAEPRLLELTASLARIRNWLGGSSEQEVRAVLAATRDPDLAGEMYWLLSSEFYRRGMDRESVDALRVAVESPRVSGVWQARCRALLSVREFHFLGRDPEHTAREAIRDAERVDDPFAKAYALQVLWLFRSIERDHAVGLGLVEEALSTLDAVLATGTDDSSLIHLRLSLLDNQVFSLQNLDRLADAHLTLEAADDMVRRYQLPAGLTVPRAVNDYWEGRWNEAVAALSVEADARELDMAFRGLRESGPMLLLLHGVAALIAVLRDHEAEANAHLAAADELPLITSGDRENCDFLVIAEALAAERDGRRDAALIALTPVLDERYSPMMLRHQWLPDAARIAVEAGDTAMAARALEVCEAEARREKQPARATAAAARCRALVHDDPAGALEAAKHYAEVGRLVELAHALEDAAVLLARAGRADEARQQHAAAVRGYRQLGANWGIRRANARLTEAGVTPTSYALRSGDGGTTHGGVRRVDIEGGTDPTTLTSNG
jgi:DNA-binding SARP family transcriptional activator